MIRKNRTQRFASALSIATIGVMGLLALGTTAGLIAAFPTAAALQSTYPHIEISANVPNSLIIVSVVAGLVPLVIWLWTLNQMRGLFQGYSQGDVLTYQSAHFIRRIGFGFLGVALVEIVLVPLQSLLLTMSNPVGERMLSVSLTSDMLGFLIAAGLMTVIGWAMSDAAQAATENKGFI